MRRLLALVVMLGVVAWLVWVFAWPYGPQQERFVEIPSGTTTRALAEQLHGSGIIASPLGLEVLRLAGGRSLKAGEYRFDHPAKVTEIYARLVRGDVYTVALTIPEGANLFDVAARVESAGLGTHAAFLHAAQTDTRFATRFDPRATSLEGFLFPATYRFSRHVTPDDMLRTMVRRFGLEAAALGLAGTDPAVGQAQNQAPDSLHRLLTLASLVERETPIPAERPLVASVFFNRLARNMPLETDPTVIYAALLRGQYRGTIYQSDLHFDSPYNTYRYAGLPPGPICNPGAVSLAAVLHPAQTDYLYFVAAGSDPLGHSRFAATLAEHARNVAAYRAARHSVGSPPQ
ncbi:endolytic transglycosylase MltG [Acidipila sp. EB88]|uniref:endolytic transglycosylase MltG n=1 Tax=Acidipila sp. EB88 TaxID=2305226 RepID=UPI000F5E4ED6|nr:endolytic transglycosylase MltG [Acidipila sp. EB88]RRA48291.1 endolytic transglycosylase MltG [Acidipila sp. EB88]